MSLEELGLRVAQPEVQHQLPAVSWDNTSIFAAKYLLWDHCAYTYAILPRMPPGKDWDSALEREEGEALPLGPGHNTWAPPAGYWLCEG